MILDLREFEDFPAKTSLEASPGEFPSLRDDVLRIESVLVDVSIQKSGEEYYCQGKVKSEMRLECARCLVEYTARLEGTTDFIIRSDAVRPDLRPGEFDDEDYAFIHGNDLRVDITDIVRQALALATPMKPLCREDCRGLCPKCGANRNEAECSCNRDEIDDRWAGLADLAGNG